MEKQEARTVAIQSMLKEAKEIAEQANRYLKEPEKWPGLKGKHARYVALIEAVNMFEAAKKADQL